MGLGRLMPASLTVWDSPGKSLRPIIFSRPVTVSVEWLCVASLAVT